MQATQCSLGSLSLTRKADPACIVLENLLRQANATHTSTKMLDREDATKHASNLIAHQAHHARIRSTPTSELRVLGATLSGATDHTNRCRQCADYLKYYC
jgi:hypothetical protein